MNPSLKDRANAYIRDRLLMGEIPAGERLSEAEIARQLGISRTPVREAMVHLEAQGLIEQHLGAGLIVKVMTRRELEEAFEVRELLEGGAAANAALRITEPELAVLDNILVQSEAVIRQLAAAGATKPTSPWSDQLNLLDMAFHLKIIDAARNRHLLRVVRDVQVLMRILQRRAHLPSEPYKERLEHILTDHRAIVEGLRKHDGEAVRQSMLNHIHWARDWHLQAFDWEERQKAEAVAGAGSDLYFPQQVLDMLRKMEQGASGSSGNPNS